MSLGVLNNLSAMYAENNLNNTQNSLSKTLQQLSSGSKINSGADDAAGLSLVNGLQANATALAQSQTNAQEGVGLLQVADGALSQVTNLLNRAVTLATEASNGTLNSSQDMAANQEYQSILSEISNIGKTTTYNQQQVFGSNTDIYTGDSSSTGASVDALNIRSLSSSNVGDTNGQMSYSSGQNVFIDLSSTAGNAAVSDYLTGGSTGTSTIDVSYLGKNADGTSATLTATISVGGTTSYANTAQGLINAINGSGLGLTANFTTAATAGDIGAANSYDTGIEISGSVGSGTNPSTSSFSGYMGAAGAQQGDNLTGSVTVTENGGASVTINMSSVASAFGVSAASMDQLVTYINTGSTGGTETDPFGVHADDSTTPGVLTLTSATGNDNANNHALTVSSSLVDTTDKNATFTYQATGQYAIGLSQDGTNALLDSTTSQSGAPAIDADAKSSGSAAIIGYTDATGQSLAGTDLTSQADAQATLDSLNAAIADVAGQDGYIGAQINTLNAVSSVISTQQENVTAAQNAVQATDYASASSNMSKYQILSQTGISALAQANSMEQEVTKLLQ